ncbi:MAG: hypothetical protein JNJ57_15570 [Saprospiraceae bacterium]|nr:hypothetical protein [Saprospiraceae bacterium]
MSKSLITACLALALLLAACTNRHEEDLDYSQIIATYVGSSQWHSASLEEVFTTPTTSHYEWVYDSLTTDPDTIRVIQFAADSFELQGGNGFFLAPDWTRFAFRESEGPSILKYERNSALSGYFNRTITIEFDLSTKSLQIESEASQNTPASNSNATFNGVAH